MIQEISEQIGQKLIRSNEKENNNDFFS